MKLNEPRRQKRQRQITNRKRMTRVSPGNISRLQRDEAVFPTILDYRERREAIFPTTPG